VRADLLAVAAQDVEARLSGASFSGAVAGSSSVQRLEENVRAVDVALTADDLDRIERVSAQGVASGALRSGDAGSHRSVSGELTRS
jgi:hypothetical protein